jgi:hypothetical protein
MKRSVLETFHEYRWKIDFGRHICTQMKCLRWSLRVRSLILFRVYSVDLEFRR